MVLQKLRKNEKKNNSNYIKRFKDKGVVYKEDSNYKLTKLLNPNTSSVEITIKRK